MLGVRAHRRDTAGRRVPGPWATARSKEMIESHDIQRRMLHSDSNSDTAKPEQPGVVRSCLGWSRLRNRLSRRGSARPPFCCAELTQCVIRGRAGTRALSRKTRTTPMFNFLHRSAPRYPTIRQTLGNAGRLSSTDPDALTVLERHGSYSGRRVNERERARGNRMPHETVWTRHQRE